MDVLEDKNIKSENIFNFQIVMQNLDLDDQDGQVVKLEGKKERC